MCITIIDNKEKKEIKRKNLGQRNLKSRLACLLLISLLIDGAIKNDWNKIIDEITDEIIKGKYFNIIFKFIWLQKRPFDGSF